MPKRRRSKAEVARDRRREGDLYLQGWIQADIADELGIDQSTVSRDLKALQEEWLQSALVDFDEAKSRELAKIDKLEREYYAGWQRSCEDAETMRKEGRGVTVPVEGEEKKTREEIKTDKVVKTSKGQAGDPRFLAGVMACIDRRCKIMGIDAPEKHDLTGRLIFSHNGLEDVIKKAYSGDK